MTLKKTLVLGATPNKRRYAFWAVSNLVKHKHEVVPLGIKKGKVAGHEIIHGKPQINDIHTITLYIGPSRQKEYYDYLLALSPTRIIFNPGTENPELKMMARAKGIETVEDCTLMMLDSGRY